MKLKNKIILMFLCINLLAVIVIQNVAYATVVTDPTKKLYIGITELRTNDTPNLGYAIGDPNTNGTEGESNKIWSLVEYTGDESDAKLKPDGNKNIYCLKAGVGFSNVDRRATYDSFFNMKTQRDQIETENSVLESIVTGTVPYKASSTSETVQVSKYNSLLALGDMLYLISNDNSVKTAYLEEAGIYSEYWDTVLTRDEIAAIQQAAIWYFTNYEAGSTTFDKTGADTSGWLNYTENGTIYKNFIQYNPTNVAINDSYGTQRQQQAEQLYRYLIQTAKSRASQYENSKNFEAPAELTTTILRYEEVGTEYVIGPIEITPNTANSTDYEVDFVVKNGGTETREYKLLNSSKQEIPANTKVKSLVGQQFYISMPVATTRKVEINTNITYTDKKLVVWTAQGTTGESTQPVLIPETKDEDIPGDLEVTPIPKKFDLALRKYIVQVGDVVLQGNQSRVPVIDDSTIRTNASTTATYKHKKDPVTVEKNKTVIYNLTIYNEGEKAGRATKVVDQLPKGLRFDRVVSGNFEQESYNTTTNTLTLKRKTGNSANLPAYGGSGAPASETIQIQCTVTASAKENRQVLTNLAWISEEIDAEANKVITSTVGDDRDSAPSTITTKTQNELVTQDDGYIGNNSNNGKDLSNPDNYFVGQQDDDDFEKLVIEPKIPADLKLVKRIVKINNREVPERIKSVDTSKLNTRDEEGKIVATTADYELDKTPVEVKKGDIVTYTLRVYNEGMIDAYAAEISEDVQEGLEVLWDEDVENLTEAEREAIQFNKSFLWGNPVRDEKGKIIQLSTDYLSKDRETAENKTLIKAFGENDGTKTEEDLDYKEVSIKFKVVSENITGTILRNEAAITEDTDEEGEPVDDRDSHPEIWNKEKDYEDDEDYDNVILKQFDLALRKFIIAVSKDDNIEDEEYLKKEDGSYKREPDVVTTQLNKKDEEGNLITTATYNHTKEPVLVQRNDIVVYMLRVYNEGDIDGYAAEIKDHLPPYLEFVENEFNTKYGWEKSEDGRTVTTSYLKDSKIAKAEKDDQEKYVLSYKEVPIMCKVIDTAPRNEKITNIADITKYEDEHHEPAEDRDSQPDNIELPEDKDLPGYKDDKTGDYIPGDQDDDDFEKVIVKKFDLALRKWVTQAIVTDKTGTKVTNTGHQPYDDPEQIVKVELNRKKLNEVTVKFRYSIRVINEGDIEGYAKEVTDYVPEGLKFVASDNPGWTDEGNNVISTKLLENTLLKPGEYADVEVLLTWVNNQNNMGLKVNTAEISKDYNEYGVPDEDSTPDNKKPGEDDIDDAPVMLSVSTGQMRINYTLGFAILISLAGGLVLIKKYVL